MILLLPLNMCILAIANKLFLNGGQLLLEAGEVFVKSPNKGLVGPERRLRAFLWAVWGAGAWGAGLRAVPRHLVYEPLQPEHGLAVHGDVLQHRAQAVLQHRDTLNWANTACDKKYLWSDWKLTLVRWVTTTLFLTDTLPSWCWNMKCFLTPERSLQQQTLTVYCLRLVLGDLQHHGVIRTYNGDIDQLLCTMNTTTHWSIITSHHSVSLMTWVSVTKAFSSGRYRGSVLYKCWSLREEMLRVNTFHQFKYDPLIKQTL